MTSAPSQNNSVREASSSLTEWTSNTLQITPKEFADALLYANKMVDAVSATADRNKALKQLDIWMNALKMQADSSESNADAILLQTEGLVRQYLLGKEFFDESGNKLTTDISEGKQRLIHAIRTLLEEHTHNVVVRSVSSVTQTNESEPANKKQIETFLQQNPISEYASYFTREALDHPLQIVLKIGRAKKQLEQLWKSPELDKHYAVVKTVENMSRNRVFHENTGRIQFKSSSASVQLRMRMFRYYAEDIIQDAATTGTIWNVEKFDKNPFRNMSPEQQRRIEALGEPDALYVDFLKTLKQYGSDQNAQENMRQYVMSQQNELNSTLSGLHENHPLRKIYNERLVQMGAVVEYLPMFQGMWNGISNWWSGNDFNKLVQLLEENKDNPYGGAIGYNSNKQFVFFDTKEMSAEIMKTGQLSTETGSGLAWKAYIKSAIKNNSLHELQKVFPGETIISVALYAKQNPNSSIIHFEDDSTSSQILKDFFTQTLQQAEKDSSTALGEMQQYKEVLMDFGILEDNFFRMDRLPHLSAFLMKNPQFRSVEKISANPDDFSMAVLLQDMTQEGMKPQDIFALMQTLKQELESAQAILQKEQQDIRKQLPNTWKEALESISAYTKEPIDAAITSLPIPKTDSESIKSGFLGLDDTSKANLWTFLHNAQTKLALASKEEQQKPEYQQIKEQVDQLTRFIQKSKEIKKLDTVIAEATVVADKETINLYHELRHNTKLSDEEKEKRFRDNNKAIQDVAKATVEQKQLELLANDTTQSIPEQTLYDYGLPKDLTTLTWDDWRVNRAFQDLHAKWETRNTHEEQLYRFLVQMGHTTKSVADAAISVHSISKSSEALSRSIARMNSSFSPEAIQKNYQLYEYLHNFSTSPNNPLPPLPRDLAKASPGTSIQIREIITDIPAEILSSIPLDQCVFEKTGVNSGNITFPAESGIPSIRNVPIKGIESTFLQATMFIKNNMHSLVGHMGEMNRLISQKYKYHTSSFDGNITRGEMERIFKTTATLLGVDVDVKNASIDQIMHAFRVKYDTREKMDAALRALGILDDAGWIRSNTLEQHIQNMNISM